MWSMTVSNLEVLVISSLGHEMQKHLPYDYHIQKIGVAPALWFKEDIVYLE